MNDSIDRQAAIDALDEQIKFCDNALCDFNISLKDEYAVKVERASLCAYKEILEDLPSVQPDLSGYSDRLWKAAYERGKAEAQPDIIHCGECKHRDPEDHKCDCGHDILWQLPRDDRWYCADAERKEGEGDADALRNVSRGTVGVSDGNSNRKVRGENTR